MSTAIAPVEDLSAAQLDQLCIQHDSHALHLTPCEALEAKLRAPRNANGAGAARLYDMESCPQIRSTGSDLAQSRSLRAVERPFLDVALVHAASHRRPSREC